MENIDKKLRIEDIDELLEKNKSRKVVKTEPIQEVTVEIKPEINIDILRESIRAEILAEINSAPKPETDLSSIKEEIKTELKKENNTDVLKENIKNIIDVLNQTLQEFNTINEKLDKLQEKSVTITESRNKFIDRDIVVKRDETGKIVALGYADSNK